MAKLEKVAEISEKLAILEKFKKNRVIEETKIREIDEN